MYYDNKLAVLKRIFGTDNIILEPKALKVDKSEYPIVDDVVVLSHPSEYTEKVRTALGASGRVRGDVAGSFSRDVQFTFGREWEEFSAIMPEHRDEFFKYFDIVDLKSLKAASVCDLGCGAGRFSYFLKDICGDLILIDFSDSIFIARNNLTGADNCLFFMCDIKKMPFAENFADFIFCLGVLHHLPTPAMDEVRKLAKFSKTILVYLYYALDNRPLYFRWILAAVTLLRKRLSKIRNPFFRKVFSRAGAYFVYIPLVALGEFLKPLKISGFIPLYDSYHGKSASRIEQDVYDRFFTPIEQRFSKKDIYSLTDTFEEVLVSDEVPYWHFLCRNTRGAFANPQPAVF